MRLQTLFKPLTDRKHRKLLPQNHSLEDIFLVSYPKSGNTWLRFLIANAIKVKYDIDREVNFFSIHDIIPDVHISSEILPQGPFGRQDLPRIIKSHAPFNPHYHRVILLIRNPADVVVSYYYYLRNYGEIPESMTLSAFIETHEKGIQSWVDHTASWLQPQRIGQILKVFSYEDLKQDTAGQLSKMMSLIGIQLSEEQLAQAVMLSSKDAMSASEQQHVSNHLIKHQKTPFVRQGKTRGGKGLSAADSDLIRARSQIVVEQMKAQWF